MPVQRKPCQQGRFRAVALNLSCWWIIVTSIMTATLMEQGAAIEDTVVPQFISRKYDPRCDSFSKAGKQTEDGGEFFSPNYPNNYFNGSDCSLTLSAPPNNKIELDFRERFQIESSAQCQHDSLRIYDGLGGHRTLLANLCGMEFPKKKIYSTGRYLYIRFKSDATAEYGGFKAVYSFERRTEEVPPLSESCEKLETGYDGVIGTSNFSKDFAEYALTGNEINCLWIINVTDSYSVSLNFWNFELKAPNNCEKNFISIYVGRLDDEHRKVMYCGTQAKNNSYKDDPVYVYLYDLPLKGSHSNFQIHYTIYRTIRGKSECNENEFDCQDSSCVHKSLLCNKRVNCKFQSDENDCIVSMEETELLQGQVLVILIIGMLLLLSLGIAMVVSCYRQWREMQKSRQETVARQSMSMGLDRIDAGQTTVSMAVTDDDHGCYVPEVDLSIFHKRSNGGTTILFDQETALDKLDPFRWRESRNSSNGSTPPPPPPPAYPNSVAPVGNDVACIHNNRTPTLNTLVLEEEDDEAADVFPPPNTRPPEFDSRRFRTDAIIQMESQRPRSFESTKSAPDVIVRH